VQKHFLTFGVVFALAAGLLAGVYGLIQSRGDISSFGAALISSGVLFFAIYQFFQNGEDAKSKFFLEEAIKGIGDAALILKDSNPPYDRITWVLAARILSRVKIISGQITNAAHLSVLEIYTDRYRNIFSELLFVRDFDSASMFYNSKLPRYSSLDDAN